MPTADAITIAVVYGAPTPPGRLAVAAAAASAAVEARGARVVNIDVSALATELLGPSGAPAVAAAVSAIGSANAVVFTSPVYRASIPGALKCLIDLLPVDALKFKPAGIVAMGGSPHHYLAVDSHLRDVLAWFGALTAPTSVYLTGKSFAEDGQLGEAATAEVGALVASLAALTAVTGLGPEPLAAAAW
ncbi:MAG TPA: NADPH-dependent FMN reductase [Ilumatobacteraceae bacterium]